MNTPPSLLEIQKHFVSGLHADNDTILQYIKTHPTLTTLEQFTIYKNSIYGALQKSLKDIYQVCHKLVGDEFFNLLTLQYSAQYQSHSADLADYGDQFADFIATFAPAKSLVYLADVARLEWAWHSIYHAENASGIDFQKLADCYLTSGEKIIFSLPPQSFLICSPYPIQKIWEVNQPSYVGDQTIILKENTEFYVVVLRKQLQRHIDTLSKVEWQLLTWMQQDLTLGEICDQLSVLYPKEDMAEILSKIVSQGWLSDFRINNL